MKTPINALRRHAPPALVLLSMIACATNPVTGRRELSLVSESQEISMGLQAADAAKTSMGLVEDPALQQYVTGLGMPMAKASERPNLPWTFTVVDDPTVNAFALPGGPVFVTRGILAHMNSEAQLVSVLGHEIGHITAKHSVSQMSKAQLAQIGVVAAVVVNPELGDLAGAASQGLGLLFLKFGRDDETEADRLGFRYMTRALYDPSEMAEMFRTLDRLGGGGEGRVPEWLSTHPNPGNRVEDTKARIAQATLPAGLKVEREPFLRRLDGIVFGDNPRQGFFRGTTFLHPDMKFQFDFPSGWKTQNQATQVAGVSSAQDAMVTLTLAGTTTPSEALTKFLTAQGMSGRSQSNAAINGFSAASAAFTSTSTDGSSVAGWVAFVSLDGQTLRLLGYTPSAKFSTYDGTLRTAVTSLRRLTDQAALNVQPARLRLVRITSPMTVEQFNRQYPSTITIAQLALINGVAVDGTLRAGLVKRVQ